MGGVPYPMGSGTASSWASLLTLRRTRATLRGPKGVSIALTVAILYGFIALLAGGMLEFFRTGATGTTVEVVTNAYSPAWWDYPGLLVVAPGGVLGLALLAQEELLTLYSGLLPVTPSGEDRAASHAAPQIRRPRVPVLGLRILLTAAGTLWGLSVLLALADPPAQAPYGAYDLLELLQRGPPGIAAVIAGLFPGLFAAWALRPGQKPRTTIFRALLLLAGATVVFGVPPPLTGWGVYGLGNEVLAAAGTPSSLGGVAFPAGDQLAFSILSAGMGLFALLMALVPRRMLRMLGGEDPPGGTGRSLWPGAPEGEGRGGTERRFARPPPSREPE